MTPADLTATVRSAVAEAMRTPNADVADAIVASLVESECRSIGAEIIDLLTDLEGFLDGWTDPQAAGLQVRVGGLLDRLGVPQVKGATS